MKVTHRCCSWAADRRCFQEAGSGVSSRQEGEAQNEAECRRQGVI